MGCFRFDAWGVGHHASHRIESDLDQESGPTQVSDEAHEPARHGRTLGPNGKTIINTGATRRWLYFSAFLVVSMVGPGVSMIHRYQNAAKPRQSTASSPKWMIADAICLDWNSTP